MYIRNSRTDYYFTVVIKILNTAADNASMLLIIRLMKLLNVFWMNRDLAVADVVVVNDDEGHDDDDDNDDNDDNVAHWVCL